MQDIGLFLLRSAQFHFFAAQQFGPASLLPLLFLPFFFLRTTPTARLAVTRDIFRPRHYHHCAPLSSPELPVLLSRDYPTTPLPWCVVCFPDSACHLLQLSTAGRRRRSDHMTGCFNDRAITNPAELPPRFLPRCIQNVPTSTSSLDPKCTPSPYRRAYPLLLCRTDLALPIKGAW
jgi:hypothetical protein